MYKSYRYMYRTCEYHVMHIFCLQHPNLCLCLLEQSMLLNTSNRGDVILERLLLVKVDSDIESGSCHLPKVASGTRPPG